MRAHFGLPSVKNGGSLPSAPCLPLSSSFFGRLTGATELDVEKRAPITVKYEIPYFTVSGIQVRYLKIVEKSGYQALPWVRYITQNGDDYRYGPYYSLFISASQAFTPPLFDGIRSSLTHFSFLSTV